MCVQWAWTQLHGTAPSGPDNPLPGAQESESYPYTGAQESESYIAQKSESYIAQESESYPYTGAQESESYICCIL